MQVDNVLGRANASATMASRMSRALMDLARRGSSGFMATVMSNPGLMGYLAHNLTDGLVVDNDEDWDEEFIPSADDDDDVYVEEDMEEDQDEDDSEEEEDDNQDDQDEEDATMDEDDAEVESSSDVGSVD
jgi:hypothetical protein